MKSLDDFLKNNKPLRRVSKLENFKDEILKLYEKNFSVEQIIEFLQKNKVETTKWNLYKYLQKNKIKIGDSNVKKIFPSKIKKNEITSDDVIENVETSMSFTKLNQILNNKENT